MTTFNSYQDDVVPAVVPCTTSANSYQAVASPVALQVPGPPPSSCRMWTRIALAIIGEIVGVAGGVAFILKFVNYDAGAWALVSAVFAGVTLYVHIQYMREFWKTWVYRLRYLMLTGCFVMTAGLCGFVAYLTLAIYQGHEFSVYGQNYYIVIVWCFMTFKWGAALFYYSRSYRNLYADEYKLPYQKL
ncbi:heme transporter hrg1-A-like isoform X1 [Lineus longissimus]|uniref:heme transporter hrg1-A-like isoform X1 n=1 Tax=Lineus longissimus TaxID=88925 RepID=UPI002B4D3D28